ncbi:transcriptional regulator [Enterobacter hormaechei]|nr:transcriptional regulator [Enterobacter hormaechei]
MKRTRLEESTCPVARSLDIIGDWWPLLIVRDARYGVAVDILVAYLTDEAGIRAT